MKRVPNPAHGAKWNRGRLFKPDELVSVAEHHEEHLRNAYPSLRLELDRIKSASVPASFLVRPGHVTGLQLAQLGVQGICPTCGAYLDNPNPMCNDHNPKNSGGGNSWLLAA